MKAGIIIDDWKLEIFKKRLDEAEYKYTVEAGLTPATISIMVEYGAGMCNVQKLTSLVDFANTEAANTRHK